MRRTQPITIGQYFFNHPCSPATRWLNDKTTTTKDKKAPGFLPENEKGSGTVDRLLAAGRARGTPKCGTGLACMMEHIIYVVLMFLNRSKIACNTLITGQKFLELPTTNANCSFPTTSAHLILILSLSQCFESV